MPVIHLRIYYINKTYRIHKCNKSKAPFPILSYWGPGALCIKQLKVRGRRAWPAISSVLQSEILKWQTTYTDEATDISIC